MKVSPPKEHNIKINKKKFSQAAKYDAIDEASRETFPTSDPPSWTLGEDYLRMAYSGEEGGHSVTQTLLFEHHLIKAVLHAIHHLLKTYEQQKMMNVALLHKLTEFFHIFVVDCHRKKEEILYPALERGTGHPSEYILNDLRREHQHGSKLIASLEKSSKDFRPSEKMAAEKMIHLLKEIQDLYSNHIAKEAEYILPYIKKTIALKDRKMILTKFKKIDADLGQQHHMLKLSNEIKKLANEKAK